MHINKMADMEKIHDMQTNNSITNSILVRHTNNTTCNAPDGGSWIDYWKNETKQDVPSICPCCGEETTEDNPIVGAHVIKNLDSAYKNPQVYITPVCRKCNSTYKGTHVLDTVFSVQSNYLCEVPR